MTAPSPKVAKPPPRIFRTALAMLPLQIVFRGGEAALPVLLATWLGGNAETDLYYLLASYFIFVASMLTGAFQDSAVIPVIIETEENDPESVPAVAGSLLGWTLLVSVGLALVLGGGAAIFGYAFTSRPSLAVALALLMAVTLPAVGARSFYVGMMNARGAFYAHPVASGIGTGLSLVLLYVAKSALGVRAVPIAMLTGELVAIAILWMLARRSEMLRLEVSLARPEPVRRMFALLRFEAAGQVVTRINPFIDQLIAGLAAVVGGGTILRYAGDVASLPTSILQATLLPVFLTRVAQEAPDKPAFQATTRRTLVYVIAILASASLVMSLLGEPICRLVFLHGEMDEASISRMAEILPYALAGVAPFGALLVLARAHVAQQNSRIMPAMGVLNSVLNAGLNLLLVGPLGLRGIALATSLTYLVVAVLFEMLLRRRLADRRG